MKYIEFRNLFKEYVLINSSDIRNFKPDFDSRRLYEWQKNGYIKKIINNYYIFTDKNPDENELNFIANKLVEPSYLSLEYALGHYGLIPEMVYWRTGITTRKTRRIASTIGNFSYQSIKKELFFGYTIVSGKKANYKIAEPEKSILDLLYLRYDLKTADDFYEMRFNEDIFKEIMDRKKIERYLKLFASKNLSKRVKILLNQIYDQS